MLLPFIGWGMAWKRTVHNILSFCSWMGDSEKDSILIFMLLPFTGGGMAWKRTVHCQRVRGLVYAQEI